jgi:hypothetical protein
MKLPGKTLASAVFSGPGTIAVALGDASVRVFDLLKDDHYALSAPSIVSSLAFDTKARLLAAATEGGSVVMWRHRGEDLEGAASWSAQPAVTVGGASAAPLRAIVAASNGRGLLAARTDASVSILKEHVMLRAHGGGLVALQSSATKLLVDTLHKASCEVTVEAPVRGLAASAHHLVSWTGRTVQSFEIVMDGALARPVGSFASSASLVATAHGVVYTAEGGNVVARSPQGAASATLQVEDAAGALVTALHVVGAHLAAVGSSGSLKTWDIARGVPRPAASFRLDPVVWGVPTAVQVNSDGTRAAVLACDAAGHTDARVIVVDLDARSVIAHDFAPRARIPVSVFWDTADPKLLAVETSAVDAAVEGAAATEVTTLFATPFDGLCVQDTAALPLDRGGLLGISAPYLLLVRRPEQRKPGIVNPAVQLVTLRDFVGLENSDPVRCFSPPPPFFSLLPSASLSLPC